MDEPPRKQPRFKPGETVSTVRPIGQRAGGRPLWDLCCGGTVERVEERDGAFYYVVGKLDDPHFHRENEVDKPGPLDARLNRLNNEP